MPEITASATKVPRIASALHASNNGTGLSVAMKRLAAGIPLSKRSKAVKALEGMRKRQDYKRAYKQESANKKREKANIMKKFQQYDESREEGTYRSEKVEEELSKGVRKSPRKKPRPDYRQDHVYSQPGDAEPEDDYTGSESEEEDDSSEKSSWESGSTESMTASSSQEILRGTRAVPGRHLKKPSKYVRATEEDFRLLADKDRKGNIQHDKKNHCGARRPCLLRPQKSATRYRIWKVTAGVEGIAKAQQEHDTKHPTCRRRVRASAKGELQVGLATSETLVCDYCGYTSSRMKLRRDRERRARGQDSGHKHGSTGQMMASMDLPVPCESSLQNLANRYSDIIEEENAEDMERWIDAVQRVNTMKGNKAGTAVRVQKTHHIQTPLVVSEAGSQDKQAPIAMLYVLRRATTSRHLPKVHGKHLTASSDRKRGGGGEAMAKTLLKKGVRVGGTRRGRGRAYLQRHRESDAGGGGANDQQERCYVHLSRGIAKKPWNGWDERQAGMERAMRKAMEAIPSCYAGDLTASATKSPRAEKRHVQSEKVEEELSKGVRKSPRRSRAQTTDKITFTANRGNAEPEDDYTGFRIRGGRCSL
ncbi:barbed-end actin filament uncapping [Branchiostoma belcheri]|nr:barbed-end actin filament uncapping [Branchiostoma belcheri]